jgi:hypothetical protein
MGLVGTAILISIAVPGEDIFDIFHRKRKVRGCATLGVASMAKVPAYITTLEP